MKVEITGKDIAALIEQLEARKTGLEQAPGRVPEIVAEIKKCEHLIVVLTTQRPKGEETEDLRHETAYGEFSALVGRHGCDKVLEILANKLSAVTIATKYIGEHPDFYDKTQPGLFLHFIASGTDNNVYALVKMSTGMVRRISFNCIRFDNPENSNEP